MERFKSKGKRISNTELVSCGKGNDLQRKEKENNNFRNQTW